jgi:hypothetical protein
MPSRTMVPQALHCERCVEFSRELLALEQRVTRRHGHAEESMQVLTRSRPSTVWVCFVGSVSKYVRALSRLIRMLRARFELGTGHDVVKVGKHR